MDHHVRLSGTKYEKGNNNKCRNHYKLGATLHLLSHLYYLIHSPFGLHVYPLSGSRPRSRQGESTKDLGYYLFTVPILAVPFLRHAQAGLYKR